MAGEDMMANSPMSKDDYEELLRLTEQRLLRENALVRLETMIANRIILKRIAVDKGIDSPADFVTRQFDAVYAEVLEELRGFCLHYCLSKLSEPEPAQDIAQEAMILLLTTHQEIRDPKAWLRGVCHNLICTHYRDKVANHAMLCELEAEESVCQMISSAEELSPQDMEDLAKVPGLADCPEYTVFQEINQYPTLRDYAKAKGISYDQAKQLSKSSRRDIKAKCLRHFGWTVTPDILGYNEYKSIQRYIRRIFEVVKAKSSSATRKNILSIKGIALENAFEDVAIIADWTVTLRGDRVYELFLVCLQTDDKPKFIQIKVQILSNHRIETLSCEVKQPTYVIENTAKVNIPTEKGICPLSQEEVAELIKGQVSPNPAAEPEPGIRIYHGRAPSKK